MCVFRCLPPHNIRNGEECVDSCNGGGIQYLESITSESVTQPGVYECNTKFNSSDFISAKDLNEFSGKEFRYNSTEKRLYLESLSIDLDRYKYYDATAKQLVNECPEARRFVELNKTCVTKCQFDAYELYGGHFICIIPRCY